MPSEAFDYDRISEALSGMKKGKLFFRRLNRGIALGLVIVLAVVLYTVVTGQTFKRADKPEIEKMMKTYLSDLAEFHVGFEGTTEEHALTEEEISARMREFSAFTDKYFTYKKSGALSGVSAQNIEEIESAYREYLESGMAGGEILSLSLEPVEGDHGLSISKTGPSSASVLMQIDGMLRVRGYKCDSIYCPGQYGYYQDTYVWESGEGEVGPEAGKETDYEGRCIGYMRLYLEKRDGEWKIVYAGYSCIDTPDMEIVEGGAGE